MITSLKKAITAQKNCNRKKLQTAIVSCRVSNRNWQETSEELKSSALVALSATALSPVRSGRAKNPETRHKFLFD